jgi:hypothetical protein
LQRVDVGQTRQGKAFRPVEAENDIASFHRSKGQGLCNRYSRASEQRACDSDCVDIVDEVFDDIIAAVEHESIRTDAAVQGVTAKTAVQDIVAAVAPKGVGVVVAG